MGDRSELLNRVELALDQIRPYLKEDRGDVEIVEITDDMRVKVKLLGSCGFCPMSLMTMKAGIEEAVRKNVPEILSVEAVNIEGEETVLN